MNLRDAVQEVYEKHGRLTPELVVQEARAENHPLHDRIFDKPLEEAAEAYYRERAHDLIRSVRVVYKEADESGPERSVRAFHAVQREAGFVYEPVERVVDDPFTRKLVLTNMEREWRSLYDRYGAMEEFLNLVVRDLSERAA